MVIPFELATAARIVFGVGAAAQVGPIAAEHGRRALVVTGRDPARAEPVLENIRAAGLAATVFAVAGEPTVADAERGVAAARACDCDVVVAIGGGSPLDAGKAIAALVRNPGPPLDYLEVVGRGRPLAHDPAPFVAVPTTAGTGSEVTRNAVLTAEAQRVKVSLRSPKMLPRAAIVDPALTLSLPPAVTADCGLDALTQLIEPFVSRKANPITDALCRDGIARAARALPRAFADGRDLDARSDMALASLLGGLALANAALGAVHGFAGPIGGAFPGAPHGAVCARLLPEVLRINARALRAREPQSPVLARLDEVARLVTGDPAATLDQAVGQLRSLVASLQIRPLAAFGLRAADLPDLADRSRRASSMKGNPIDLTDAELHEALAAAL
ncbi:Alcohol dehydrogenase, class IV [Nannocystis exedens]|uniref:Alcohol dehydrogenase, class IV n=1 Tax=Nannocystis exedens TaxID=54 RepID=A0A1I1VFJ5_9BACT|nr:iron-containing alcohol dehydrogenase [Nannocystis exedens]PCC72441.1 alcohol dehydrogenase [Nannocystis exedens]SFD79210.1 Alcohol dehydrogenase, class IV [Nannocystis exedens]